MNNRIYISTNAFQNRDLVAILEICKENNFKNIELSACQGYNQQIYKSLLEFREQFSFLLHNYFPPPKVPFVINLSSNSPVILKLSKDHCLRAIDLAAELKAPFYSVHAGACYDIKPEQLGKAVKGKYDILPRSVAKSILIESLQQLADHASERNILLAIENHVLASSHLIEGQDYPLLGVTAEEILDIISSVGRDNVGVLIDLGHLKVTAQTLNFDPIEFLDNLSQYIRIFHLSDNNGEEDAHHKFDQRVWFKNIVKKFNDAIFVIESCCLEIEEIKSCQSDLASMLTLK